MVNRPRLLPIAASRRGRPVAGRGTLAPALLALVLFAGQASAAPDDRPAEAAGPDATRSVKPVADTAPPSSRPRAARASKAGGERPPEVLAAQRMFQVLAAEIAAQRGQIGTAAATWLSVARDSRDPRAARRATELALSERSGPRAIEAAELWLELEPDAPAAAQTLETLLLGAGQFTRAELLIVRRLAVARADGRVADLYGPLSRALLRASDRAGALALLERVSAPDVALPAALLARATLAHASGDTARAAAELRRAGALAPGSEDVALAASTVLPGDEAGRREAIALLDAFVTEHPRSPRARFALARLHALDGRLDAALAQLQRTLIDDPDDPSTLFAAAQLAHELNRPRDAEAMMLRWVALPGDAGRERNPGWQFLARVAEEDGRLEQALDWLDRVEQGDERFEATLQRAVLLGRLQRADEGRTLLRTLSPASPRERARTAQTEAELLRDQGRTPEAYEIIDAALQAQPDDPQLLYDRAMLGERLGRLERMEADLRRLIALRPDHAHAYNALGYTFADRAIRLDEAQALLEKAVRLAPADPHILDSMGWLAFRQGRLDDALAWLRRAWKARPDPEIAAHLGEVLWAAGQADEARAIWGEAHSRDPGNALLRETRTRLGATQ